MSGVGAPQQSMRNLFLISVLAFLAGIGGGLAPAVLAADGAVAGRPALRNQLEARIKSMDANGDGAIDRGEYLARAEDQFKRFDLNGDGRITPDETQKVRERVGALRGGDAQFP